MADEARRLLRLKQQQQLKTSATASTNAVKSSSTESPWGRVNKLGHTFCVACSQSFKDKILWEAHTSSRKHRYGITLLIMFEFH